jgi:chaperonin GroES
VSYSDKFWHNFCIKAIAFSANNKKQYQLKKVSIMNCNIKPLADRVLVKPAEAEQKTAGGIIIPDTAKEKPQRGTVVAVGPGKKDEPMTVAVNDTVLYGKYSGTEIQIDGETYLIMKESDIYAIC